MIYLNDRELAQGIDYRIEESGVITFLIDIKEGDKITYPFAIEKVGHFIITQSPEDEK